MKPALKTNTEHHGGKPSPLGEAKQIAPITPSKAITRHRSKTQWVKSLFFPGIDLGTYVRACYFRRFLRRGNLLTLDAGCGNGALTYEACRLGNKVIGVTLDSEQIRKNKEFFSFKGLEERAEFQCMNLYKITFQENQFDQIICSETIEHIKQDAVIVKEFFRILKPNGVLHLCAPYKFHPNHHLGRTNQPEDGGHVIDGYTIESLGNLAKQAGFRIEFGGGLVPYRAWRICNLIDRLRVKFGDKNILLISFVSRMLLWFFPTQENLLPHSVHVIAIKPNTI